MIWVIQSNKVQVPKPAPAALARSECTTYERLIRRTRSSTRKKRPGNGALEIGRADRVRDLVKRFAIVAPAEGC
jgi:hypothetical protein